LRDVVHQQYSELRRSLAGLGNYQLAPAFLPRYITKQMRWNSMTEEAKETAFKKFLSDNGILHLPIFTVCHNHIHQKLL
jgi:hypothetical protein